MSEKKERILPLLFYNFSCDMDSFCRKDRRLGSLYERLPGFGERYNNLHEKLVTLGVEKGVDSICDELDDLGEFREMQGFINGFRLGMTLRGELAVSKLDTGKEAENDA